MNPFEKLRLLPVLMLLIGTSIAYAQIQVPVTHDPAEAELVYDDVHNFLTALEIIEKGHDPIEALDEYYMSRASAAFRDQIEGRNMTPESMAALVASDPEIGAKIRDALTEVTLREEEIRSSLAELKALIPGAVFLPNHYMVGTQGGWMGEPSGGGIKIVMAPKPFDYSRLHRLVFHENVHVQQALTIGLEEYQQIYGPKKSLLALALREGVPTYLTRLALGPRAEDPSLEYFRAHEEALWRQFDQEKLMEDPGDWMWKEPSKEGQPRDMGYLMGAAIVESFYEKAEDKAGAIQDILGIVDYEGFLEASGYRDKFGSP